MLLKVTKKLMSWVLSLAVLSVSFIYCVNIFTNEALDFSGKLTIALIIVIAITANPKALTDALKDAIKSNYKKMKKTYSVGGCLRYALSIILVFDGLYKLTEVTMIISIIYALLTVGLIFMRDAYFK